MPFQICRICYTRGNSLLQLDKSNNYEQKLSSCIPEIDIHILKDPGICRKCADKLDIAFELRNLCLENEKRYNSTFKEKDKDSTSVNQNAVNCNEDFTESDVFEIDESNDNQNLLDVIDIITEAAIFCSLCDKQFSSNHDKKLHDFKMHRQLQYRNLKSLLSPICRNSDDQPLVLQNVIDYTVEFSINNNNSFDSNTNESQHSAMLSCNECNMKFTDKYELESHKSTHLRKSCHVCMKTCDNENELGEHLKLHLVKCCGESYPTSSLLQLHTYKNHKMTCGICKKKFTQFSILFDHLSEHMKATLYSCADCVEQFNTIEALNEHNCNGSYTLHEAHDDHLEIHNDIELESTITTVSSKRSYKCRKCNISFSSRSLLAKHKYSVHTFGRVSKKYPDSSDLEKNVLVCQLCGRKFELHVHLKMHVLQFHCDKIPTVPIVDCRIDKFYREQEGLQINFNVPPEYVTNTSEIDIQRKKFIARSKCICFICRVLFKKVSTLYLHGRSKHVMCCNENTASVEAYLQHNLKHYDKAEKDGVHKNILCSMCKLNHKNYVSLLAHNCRTKFTKREIRMKRKKRWNDRIESEKDSRCTIEIHKSDSSDESRHQQSNNASSSRSSCEICKKHFDCKTRLMDHIKMHI